MDTDLAALAAAYGVATEFWDQAGQHQEVPAETVVAVLAALGVDATTPESIASAPARAPDPRLAQDIAAGLRACARATPRPRWVHLPHGDSARLWIELEDGGTRSDVVQVDRWVEPVDVDGALVGEATFAFPADLPTGWHRLHGELRSADGATRPVSTTLVVTPRTLGLPERLRGARLGLRRAALLRALAAARGARRPRRPRRPRRLERPRPRRRLRAHQPAARGVAGAADGAVAVPARSTRRFANPIYLRVEDVPEYAYLGEARAQGDGDARRRR